MSSSDLGTQLNENQDLVTELSKSVTVSTWKNSSVVEVLDVLESFGYDNVFLREISCRRFLLTFQDQELFDQLDIDLLGLGFLDSVFSSEELVIIPRLVYMERLGLPFQFWSRSDFPNLAENWG